MSPLLPELSLSKSCIFGEFNKLITSFEKNSVFVFDNFLLLEITGSEFIKVFVTISCVF